jgi:hypothetical protein
MDLDYQALARAALIVVESAEDAYRLGALDRVLKPWIRDRVQSLVGLLDSCDTARELAEDTRSFARTAADYSELRERLFSDAHHVGPEPPWRVVARGTLTVRVLSGVLLPQPTFVLRRHDAGSNVPGAATWQFTVLANPSDPADEGTSFVVMVATGEQDGGLLVQTSKELENQRAWYQQLDYGLRALGIRPILTALYDPDRHRMRPTDDGL